MAAQPDSAQLAAWNAGITHGTKATVEVVVGVTPGRGRTPAMAHFCSSRMKVIRAKKPGDGGFPSGDVVFPNGIPVVGTASIVRMTATVVSNGALRLCTPRDAVAVRIPTHCREDSPWAFDGGAEQVAAALGCRDVNEMFEKHGVPVG